MTTPPTFEQAVDAFLSNIEKSMPNNTYKSYKSDLSGEYGLMKSIADEIKPHSPIANLTEELCASFMQRLLDIDASASTRQRRASAMREFIRFVDDRYGLSISVDKLNYKLKSRKLLTGVKNVREYPEVKIQRMLDFALKYPARDLTAKRDVAFIYTLAQTGLRVSEACGLKIGSIDASWSATFIGKGGDLSSVNISTRARPLITAYLKAREPLDKASGMSYANLPLFARHDATAGKGKVKKINPKIGEEIVHNMTLLALGEEYDPAITCHMLRHYFITKIYELHGDLKEAQELARHKQIVTTQRYTHRSTKRNARVIEDAFK